MELEEVRRLKARAESDIAVILNHLQIATGTRITNVEHPQCDISRAGGEKVMVSCGFHITLEV